MIQGIRMLYSTTLDGLKIEAENEKLHQLTEIESLQSMIIIIFCISYFIFHSYNGFLYALRQKSFRDKEKRKIRKNRIGNMQTLKRVINENKKYLDTVRNLDKPYKKL